MKKVILFDAKYLLYRQHFAHKALSAGTFPTGGMFGFWNEVYRMKDEWPGYSMVFCWDGVGPSWRTEKSGYKANREITPDTILVQKQEKVMREILDKLGFWTPKIDGLEGDDIIGVLSGSWKGVKEILIYSGDQDMYQLVGPGVKVLSPRKLKNGSQPPTDLILDEWVVERVMGVGPAQVCELRALAGDPTDNIKGLPGIGPKKAMDLYAEGVRASKKWEELSNRARIALMGFENEWMRVSKEYEMIKLARASECLRFTVAQRETLQDYVNQISKAPERRLRDKDERSRAWLTYIGQYEFKELFTVRHQVWQIP